MCKCGYVGPKAIIPAGHGKRIDDLLFQKNMNYKDLADAVGVKRNTIYNVIEGKDCRLKTMINIADFLCVSIDYLVYGKEK